ncbi:MAG: DUF1036 domain-containing protein [Alphaproteobacteria bacterium]
MAFGAWMGLRSLAAAAILAATLLVSAGGEAAAETRLCNRTSLVVEAALAVQAQNTVATRGWFRLDPGQCRVLLQTAQAQGRLYLHTRTPVVYPPSPLGLPEDSRFCVGEGDFLVAGAERCTRAGHRLAPFAEVKSTVVDGIAVLFLSEPADFDLPQARLAGVQRLLALMGYDPGPVDGLEGPKTTASVASFLVDRGLPADSLNSPDIFDHLMAAARSGEGPGFVWCNDTSNTVMAALGVEESGQTTTRGWFRVEPGRCLRPALDSRATRVHSFAEQVDRDGRPILRAGEPVRYAGDTLLCVRTAEFEFQDQTECEARGGNMVPFVRIVFDGRRRAIVRFKDPS